MFGHNKKLLARMIVICLISTILAGNMTAVAEQIDENPVSAETHDLCMDEYIERILCGDTTDTDIYPNAEAVEFLTAEYTALYVDGVLAGRGVKFGDVPYAGLRQFAEMVSDNVSVEWEDNTKSALITTDGLSIAAAMGDQYLTANGRYLYVAGGIQNVDGFLMAPIAELAKAFGVGIRMNDNGRSVTVEAKGAIPIDDARKFYDEEDVMWLSRLIHAESANQSLEGKIAVGNVVMNRVKYPYCPDTIYEVIFDNKHGVQFTPTATGTIYMEPAEESIVAAKICLEGYNLVGDSLFFVNPELGQAEWFSETRTYVISYGDHDFYA